MSWIDTVNRYWFEELNPNDWFTARPEIDAQIKDRFADLRTTLKQNPPSPTALNPKGYLAAIIVFDQFSRHLFRKSPEAYTTDAEALALAIHATELGLDKSLGPNQRQFLYMPFMHSENPAMQSRSVSLFRLIGIPEPISYAEHHKGIIDRFGRFPHRNEILGRRSTEAESEFLRNESP